MTTTDLIDSFCRQSIIGIDPIDVFLTIGAQLWINPNQLLPDLSLASISPQKLLSDLSTVYFFPNHLLPDLSQA
jgi:hypothetical protein